MSVVSTEQYREAFRLHAMGQPLSGSQRAVLERGRSEARLPEGRYPLPCEVETTPPHRGGDEVAAVRVDGPRPVRRNPRPARFSRWDDEVR